MLHCGGAGLSEVGLFSRSTTSARTHMFQFSRKLSCPRVLHRATVFVTLGGYEKEFTSDGFFKSQPCHRKTTLHRDILLEVESLLGFRTGDNVSHSEAAATQKLQQSFRIGYESSSRTDGDCLRPRRVVLQKSYRSCRTAEPGRARNC